MPSKSWNCHQYNVITVQDQIESFFSGFFLEISDFLARPDKANKNLSEDSCLAIFFIEP